MTDTPPSPSEYDKQHWKEAERAFDRQDAYADQHASQLEAFALQGIRTLGLTSAGGIAAVLGFYSANYERLSKLPDSLGTINWMLTMLFLAMLSTLLVCLFGYFSQVAYTESIWSRKRSYQFPYVEDGDKTKRFNFLGDACRVLAISFALAAAVCLGLAAVSFLKIAN